MQLYIIPTALFCVCAYMAPAIPKPFHSIVWNIMNASDYKNSQGTH